MGCGRRRERRCHPRISPRTARRHLTRHRFGSALNRHVHLRDSSDRWRLRAGYCRSRVRRPAGVPAGPAAGVSPRGPARTAWSNSRRLSSSTGSPISSRRRGSTGTARRFETSQGCSPRITSSGPPSRPMTKGNVGKRRDAATDGHAVGGHAAGGDATADCCDSCDKPPSHDTSRRQRPNSWPAWGRSFLLRARSVVATSGRAALDRHPQPLTGSHATVRTAREQSGFKAGLRRREKSGLERG